MDKIIAKKDTYLVPTLEEIKNPECIERNFKKGEDFGVESYEPIAMGRYAKLVLAAEAGIRFVITADCEYKKDLSIRTKIKANKSTWLKKRPDPDNPVPQSSDLADNQKAKANKNKVYYASTCVVAEGDDRHYFVDLDDAGEWFIFSEDWNIGGELEQEDSDGSNRQEIDTELEKELLRALSIASPTGASWDTARQDNLPVKGVAASEAMAERDWRFIGKQMEVILRVAEKCKVYWAIIAAIASRESRGGNPALLPGGLGDNGHGYGAMQVDFRAHNPVQDGIWGEGHLTQATDIFVNYYGAIKAKFPTWSADKHLEGALCAYNFGVGNVKTLGGMNIKTTGNDYGADAVARAKYYQMEFDHLGGVSGGGSVVTKSGDVPMLFPVHIPEHMVYANRNPQYPRFTHDKLGFVTLTGGFMEPTGHGYKSRVRKAIMRNGGIKNHGPGRYNIGIDYVTGNGLALAWYSGVVEHSRWEGGYGNRIHIKLDEMFTYQGKKYVVRQAYAHLKNREKNTGDRVAQFERIAIMGGTGGNYPPHIDLSTYIYVDGDVIEVNPELLGVQLRNS